jgi:hypothetical protein
MVALGLGLMTGWSRGRARVDSFAALVSQRWPLGVNALCWPRALEGDFDELARCVAPVRGLADVDPDALDELPLSAAGRAAAAVVREDWARLAALGLAPQLSAVTAYPRDERGWAVSVDVHSFHVDRAPLAVDTWLCTYAGEPTEALGPGEATRRVDDPSTRAALARSVGAAGADLDDALREHDLDLHYAAREAPYSLGRGHLWRLAVWWPGCRTPPCVHRAPEQVGPRLLLIA